MIKLGHPETKRHWLKVKVKGQGTSDKIELSQSGEASDELSAWLSGPGRPDLNGPGRLRTGGPNNQRKARR